MDSLIHLKILKKQNELDKRKRILQKLMLRDYNMVRRNNLLKFNIFSNDICCHILSYVIDDIVKFSSAIINHYLKKYYGNFSCIGIRSLWSKKK